MSESFLNGRVTLHCGDCIEVMAMLLDDSIDSVVCDPPYHLTSIVKRFGADSAAPAKAGKTGAYARASAGFMGKVWDGGDIAFRPETWAAVLRVLKPGGHLVAFGGTRTYHRMACAIEDAGFEIRDTIAWLYGSGFPKSHNVGKGIDRQAGANREVIESGNPVKRMIPGADQNKVGWEKNNGRVYIPNKTVPATDESTKWDGFGTALKPAFEPIILARKPLAEDTVASNVLKWGTGAINIDGCRVGNTKRVPGSLSSTPNKIYGAGLGGYAHDGTESGHDPNVGRWPANAAHDGSDEVLSAFPNAPGQQRYVGPEHGDRPSRGIYGDFGPRPPNEPRDSGGSAARFFYTAKADSNDRIGSKHPTVKPIDLMQWLVRLVTPPKGTVFDPFAGTGTTGEAAYREGFNAVLIERETEYQSDIRRRMALILAGPEERSRESIKARGLTSDAGPLFGDLT